MNGLRQAIHEPARDVLYELRSDVKTVLSFIGSLGHNVDDAEVAAHRLDLVHAGDHLLRLIRARLDTVTDAGAGTSRNAADQPSIVQLFHDAHVLLSTDGTVSPAALDALRNLSSAQAEHRRTSREATLNLTAQGEVPPDTAQDRLLAEAWRDRIAYHAWRCAHHLSRPDTR